MSILPIVAQYLKILKQMLMLMTEIENISCVRSVIKVNPVIIIERGSWGSAIILIRVNDGVYICTC